MKAGALLIIGGVFAALWALFRKREAEAATVNRSQPAPAAPVPQPAAPAAPASYGSSAVFRSDPSAVVVDATGWRPLPSGGFVALLYDPQAQLVARLTYADAKRAAARFGARLVTQRQVDEIVRGAGCAPIPPLTLVHTKADGARMGSREFAQRFDADARPRIEACDKEKPFFIAKCWLSEDDRGAPGLTKEGEPAAINYGFWDGKRMLQNPGRAHNEGHVDYSQYTYVWKEAA